ncbi:hypothetical protein CEUSTIGMA_g11381.t1 [Chlamydomonas eustigma]|uniref:ABC transporter domain-containing protein n=1 Tax=Chlamydomonas eustigma TaxID=1157962 RepID=A0A250XLL1_9CHLO|nr:hypothetical protein CEUSTIGMA_g11381.t1 [Chlamydomonas eustigma]|eukprot:GAX83957.1 hypothetical protein CEUSTIGMA_g11381.t1 [Chlamydomonas eustigma]
MTNETKDAIIEMNLGKRKSLSSPDMRLNVEDISPKMRSRTGPGVGEEKDVPPAILSWQGLVVGLRSVNKVLLNNLSGQITTGYWAIMGPSGSGKTTLLNTLACRLDRNTQVKQGELRLNGKAYSISELKKMAGYVMQDDMLNGNFTVYETLQYTADLRLEKELTKEEKRIKIENVIEQMGLAHTCNTIVGSPLKKGISGGERKRVCVAMELLTSPVLLFLDEPTSGLDSVTAKSLCSRLKVLAANCTIVNTIHQPQAKIFFLFDKLILLKSGRLVYMGRADKVLDFFTALGYPCPEYENPADHIMDCITPNARDTSLDLKAKALKFEEAFEEQDFDLTLGVEHPTFMIREVTPWTGQFIILFKRTLKEQWRKRSMLLTQLLQSVIIAVLIGTVFLKIGQGQSSTTRRQPVLFFCAVNQGVFGALIQINSFPSERLLSLRERAAGTYYASAYFLAKTTAETITQLITPVVFSCTVYWLVGFQVVAAKFFIFTAFMILCSLAATSLALAVSALCRTVDMSVTVLPMILELCRLFGGFFLSPANIPKYFEWLDLLSYVQYTYVGISLNELTGLELSGCVNGVPAGCYSSGETAINNLGLEYLTIEKCAGILISYIVICRIIAYLGVRYITW